MKSATTTAATPVHLHHEDSTSRNLKQSEISQKHSVSVAFRNLNVFGFGNLIDYQKTFSNYPLVFLGQLGTLLGRSSNSRIDILRDFEGVIPSGEMLLVLGRPGSGCTTFLKTLVGYTHGLHIDQTSQINYQGTPCPG